MWEDTPGFMPEARVGTATLSDGELLITGEDAPSSFRGLGFGAATLSDGELLIIGGTPGFIPEARVGIALLSGW